MASRRMIYDARRTVFTLRCSRHCFFSSVRDSDSSAFARIVKARVSAKEFDPLKSIPDEVRDTLLRLAQVRREVQRELFTNYSHIPTVILSSSDHRRASTRSPG